MKSTTIPQPKTLTVNGNKYRLAIPYRVIDEAVGKSEGPSYRRSPDVPGVVFLPDAPYLLRVTSRPSIMHAIQIGPRARGSTPALLRRGEVWAKTPRRTTGKRSRG